MHHFKIILKQYALIYMIIYLTGFTLGQVYPHIQVRWITFSLGHVCHWIKQMKLVFIFLNGVCTCCCKDNLLLINSRDASECITVVDFVLKRKRILKIKRGISFTMYTILMIVLNIVILIIVYKML